jgi:plasmid segregation protein ParM
VSYNVKANVIMQPFGALASMAFDNQGNVANQDFFDLTGVIDIGGKTTNILTAKNFSDISPQTISKDIGGWDIIRAVRARLQVDYPKSNLSDHQIADAIVEKSFKEFGQDVDISELLEEILPLMAEDIVGKASSLWGSGANLSQIIVTGGGSRLVGDYIVKAFPHAVLVDEPVFANAIGYYRYGQAIK